MLLFTSVMTKFVRGWGGVFSDGGIFSRVYFGWGYYIRDETTFVLFLESITFSLPFYQVFVRPYIPYCVYIKM